MKVKKPIKKPRPPRKSFVEKLADVLMESGLGTVDLDEDLGWVELKKDGIILCFSFNDNKGDKLEDIGVFKEIWQCVDQERLWSASKSQTA